MASAIELLRDRAMRLENNMKARRLEDSITFDKVVGGISAGASSILAGYVDGRLDLVDGEDGNGTTLMGIPVMPIGAGLLMVTGIIVGGKAGSAISYSGLGVGCGWGYSAASRQGKKDASK